MTARFLVAKYIPELHRMEPRNIGIIVWYGGAAEVRLVDPVQSPVVTDTETFKYRTEIWLDAISKGEIVLHRRDKVTVKDSHFLDELRRLEDDHYMLADAGELMEPITKKELPSVADFLFEDIVSSKAATNPKEERRNFRKECKQLFSDSGYGDRVVSRFEVTAKVYGVPRPIHFTYGVGNGVPEAVFQTVDLHKEGSVYDAATRLHSLEETLDRKHRAALVKTNGVSSEKYDTIGTNRSIIDQVAGTVIDLADYDSAVSSVASMLA